MDYINSISNSLLKDFKLGDDEFLGEDNNVYCKNCNSARTLQIEGHYFRCMCRCQSEKFNKEELEKKQKETIDKLNRLQNNAFLGQRYREVRFENTEIPNKTFEKAYDICYNYVVEWKKNLKCGYGIYLYGDTGVGKTHLTACMGNALLSNGVPVMFTSFVEISNRLLKSFSTNESEDDFLNKIMNVEFLVIDDIGAERIKTKNGDTFMQDKIYYIIDSRYKKQLPTIYSSNYSLGQLIDERGLEKRTTDRIAETTVKVSLANVPNYRATKYKNLINKT